MSSEEWTPERIKILMGHWEEGLPTSEIGRRLGVTKNAVVGKVHRLGLKKRQSPIRQSTNTTVQPKKPKKVASPTPVATKRPSGDVVRLEELTNAMCCWPEGEPGKPDFHFCGKSAVHDKPYCEAHCARAYVKVSKDKRKLIPVISTPKPKSDTEAA
ncbi:MAG: global cell cycle regulator GcrA-like protein [Magnetovibrio sp.]|nr:global cell cycle regulator GcrA-like protein [Magnetovibrio sp.]